MDLRFLILLAAILFVPQGRAGIIAHWRLDGDATDSARNHHGVVVGGDISWPTTNKIVGPAALQLNSANHANTWIQVTNTPDLQFGTNDFTVAFWVRKLVPTSGYLN